MIHVTNSISVGEDVYNVCGIFYDYFDKLKESLNNEYQLTKDLPNEIKDEIFFYVYDYAMIKIYPKIFPKEPTESDKFISLKLENISKLTPEQLKIKPENLHTEIIDLIIKSNFYL